MGVGGLFKLNRTATDPDWGTGDAEELPTNVSEGFLLSLNASSQGGRIRSISESCELLVSPWSINVDCHLRRRKWIVLPTQIVRETAP